MAHTNVIEQIKDIDHEIDKINTLIQTALTSKIRELERLLVVPNPLSVDPKWQIINPLQTERTQLRQAKGDLLDGLY